MTPKEKAIDLYSIYYNRIEHKLSEEYSRHEKDVVKECALIAVNEIIANIEPSVSMDVIESRVNYFQAVKEEIEKL